MPRRRAAKPVPVPDHDAIQRAREREMYIEHEMDEDAIEHYTDSSWFVPASDDKNQSIRTSFRAAPELLRQISEILRDNHFPYKTDGDLIRHAVFRHLQFLRRLQPRTKTHFLGAMKAIQDAQADSYHHSELEKTFENVLATIKRHEENGFYSEARKLAFDVRSTLSLTADSAYKRRFQVAFQEHIGHLLDPRWEAPAPDPVKPVEPDFGRKGGSGA